MERNIDFFLEGTGSRLQGDGTEISPPGKQKQGLAISKVFLCLCYSWSNLSQYFKLRTVIFWSSTWSLFLQALPGSRVAWCTLLQLGGAARSMFSSPPSSTTTTIVKVRWIQRALVEKVFFRSLPHEFQVPIATENYQAENPGLMAEGPLSVYFLKNLVSRICKLKLIWARCQCFV